MKNKLLLSIERNGKHVKIGYKTINFTRLGNAVAVVVVVVAAARRRLAAWSRCT